MPSLNVATRVFCFFCCTQFVILTNDNIELNVQCSDSASRQTFTSVKTAVFVVCRESSQNPCSCLLIDIPTEAFYFSHEDTFGRSPGAPRGREKKYYCIFGIFKPRRNLLKPFFLFTFLHLSFLSAGSLAAMTKSYEFNWQKHLPEFMQEGASFDRFDEVRRSKARGVKKKQKKNAEPPRSVTIRQTQKMQLPDGSS